ncbi:MAG: hypothetical protein NVSMB52_19430 [Chloroflexota bacterium]
MSDEKVLEAQLDFYRRGRAGCRFAAHAATEPARYGWHHRIASAKLTEIESEIVKAIDAAAITTLSLTFPEVREPIELLRFVEEVRFGRLIFLQQDELFDGFRCLGLRVRVGNLLSWVSGFGPFDFLPATRRSPNTELVFRVKPRPDYDWVLKPSPEGVIHLADMDMRGLSEQALRRMWDSSYSGTEQVLKGKPDFKSAAKTTFAIPEALCPW